MYIQTNFMRIRKKYISAVNAPWEMVSLHKGINIQNKTSRHEYFSNLTARLHNIQKLLNVKLIKEGPDHTMRMKRLIWAFAIANNIIIFHTTAYLWAANGEQVPFDMYNQRKLKSVNPQSSLSAERKFASLSI